MAKNNYPPYKNSTEDKMIDVLDELDAFQNEYMKLIPQIREMLKAGAKGSDILKHGTSLAAARLLNIAATDKDSGKALAAIKDILDRTEGKAKESKEITHRLAEMKEDDLDNLLNQELKQLEAMADEES